jgi:hypothetical protein
MAKRITLLVLICLCVAQVASAGLITSITRRNPDGNSGDTPPVIAGPLAEDAVTFVDRTHQYNEIPAFLVGADYVVVANDDKDNANYELDVEVAGPATLYLLIDNRAGHGSDGGAADLVPDLTAAGMTWVAAMGFVDTGDNIGVDEGGDGSVDNWASIFALTNVNGVVTLLQQNDATNAGGRNMYGVAVTPEPATIALLGLGGLVLRRRKK